MEEWTERFSTWVQEEPVRAAEAVRALLFALTGILATFGAEVEVTAVSGAVTALFSLYASKTTRNVVSPVKKVRDAVDQERHGTSSTYFDEIGGYEEMSEDEATV